MEFIYSDLQSTIVLDACLGNGPEPLNDRSFRIGSENLAHSYCCDKECSLKICNTPSLNALR